MSKFFRKSTTPSESSSKASEPSQTLPNIDIDAITPVGPAVPSPTLPSPGLRGPSSGRGISMYFSRPITEDSDSTEPNVDARLVLVIIDTYSSAPLPCIL